MTATATTSESGSLAQRDALRREAIKMYLPDYVAKMPSEKSDEAWKKAGIPWSRINWPERLAFTELEAEHKLPRGLLAATMSRESGGDPGALSSAGAGGLFQIMPDTAKLRSANPWMPSSAARGAAQHFRILTDMFKAPGATDQQALPLALAAYNWGDGNLKAAGYSGAMRVPETRAYVPAILGQMGLDAAKLTDYSTNPSMAAFYGRGGEGARQVASAGSRSSGDGESWTEKLGGFGRLLGPLLGAAAGWMIGNFGGFGLMGTILSTLIAAVVGARWLGNDNTSTATASATASQPRAQGQGQQQQQAAAPEQRPVIARFTSEDVERVLAEPNAARDKVRFAKIAGNGGVALQPVAADGSGPQNHTQSVALIEKIQQQCARAGVKGGLALLAPDAQGNHGMVCTPPVVAATPQAAPSRS